MARPSSLIDLVQAEPFVFVYSFILLFFPSLPSPRLSRPDLPPQRHAASGVNLLLSALRS